MTYTCNNTNLEEKPLIVKPKWEKLLNHKHACSLPRTQNTKLKLANHVQFVDFHNEREVDRVLQKGKHLHSSQFHLYVTLLL